MWGYPHKGKTSDDASSGEVIEMSVALDFQCSSINPSKVSGAGTAVKYFPRPLSASLGGKLPTTPNATTVGTSTGNPTGALWIPTGPTYDGQLLKARAVGTWGTDSGDPSGTIFAALYAVTGTLQNPVYTKLGSTNSGTAPSVAGILQPWALEVTLFGDSGSGILSGWYFPLMVGIHQTGNGFTPNTAPQVLDTNISGLDFVNGNPALQRGAVLGLVVGIQFGTSDSTNAATMTQFTVGS